MAATERGNAGQEPIDWVPARQSCLCLVRNLQAHPAGSARPTWITAAAGHGVLPPSVAIVVSVATTCVFPLLHQARVLPSVRSNRLCE